MRRITGLIVFGLSAVGAASAFAADLPAGAGRLSPQAQQALQSRARLQGQAGLGGNLGGQGAGIGSGAKAGAAIGAGGQLGPQLGTGRLGVEANARANARGGFNGVGGRVDAGVRAEQSYRGRDNRRPPQEAGSSESTENYERSAPSRRDRSAQAQLDILLNNRLASIDRMRDTALISGNAKLLAQADQLEAQARLQYARQLQALREGRDTVNGELSSRQAEFSQETSAEARTRRAFGASTSTDARLQQEGRDFGASISGEARLQGRAFGNSASSDTQFGTDFGTTQPADNSFDD